MLTLEDLECNVTVQGNVRISFWSGDEEVVLGTTVGVCDIDECISENDLEVYEECGVEYIYAAPDGYLHIELDPEDAQEVYDELEEQAYAEDFGELD